MYQLPPVTKREKGYDGEDDVKAYPVAIEQSTSMAQTLFEDSFGSNMINNPGIRLKSAYWEDFFIPKQFNTKGYKEQFENAQRSSILK